MNTDVFKPLDIEIKDEITPISGTPHVRQIVRAIVLNPENQKFLFVNIERHDEFGDGIYIETSGGGIEEGESEIAAIKRELSEELGVDVDVITKLGVVKDSYNIIARTNINNYYLVRVTKFHENHITELEDHFKLKRVELSLDEALSEYAKRTDKLGLQLASREVPVIKKVKLILENL